MARANLALRTRRPHAHFPRPVIAPNGPMRRTFPAVLAISSYHLILRGIPGDGLPNIGNGAPAPVINTRARAAPSPWLTQLSLETGSSSVQGTRAAVTCIQPRPPFPKYAVSGGRGQRSCMVARLDRRLRGLVRFPRFEGLCSPNPTHSHSIPRARGNGKRHGKGWGAEVVSPRQLISLLARSGVQKWVRAAFG